MTILSSANRVKMHICKNALRLTLASCICFRNLERQARFWKNRIPFAASCMILGNILVRTPTQFRRFSCELKGNLVADSEVIQRTVHMLLFGCDRRDIDYHNQYYCSYKSLNVCHPPPPVLVHCSN